MHLGIVKKFNKQAGYGIISPLDSSILTQAYFHHSDVVEPSSLGEGDEVTFTFIYGTRGIQATEIIKVEPPSRTCPPADNVV